MSLDVTASVEDFLQRPLRRALVGNGFVYAQPAPALFYIALFGRPTSEDMRPLLRALPLEMEDRVPVHASLVDARRVDGVNADAFGALAAYVSREAEALARKVSKLCLVRPEGFSGASVAGFFSVVAPPYPVLVTATLDDVPGFLQPEAPASLVRELDELLSSLADRPVVVARVAAILTSDGFQLDLTDVARLVGVSPRTLQRRLSEANTSFVEVQRAARLEQAARRMLETDDPLTVIALECGYASAQHFASEWRSAHGTTPSAWRRSQRAR